MKIKLTEEEWKELKEKWLNAPLQETVMYVSPDTFNVLVELLYDKDKENK
jgi:hypothetical protein